MDAFAAAICKGLAIKKNFLEKSLVIALFFGVFQGLMPLIGYFLGSIFAEKLQAIDHWIAFVLLGLIGLNMIREARDKTCPVEEDRLDIKKSFYACYCNFHWRLGSWSLLCLFKNKNFSCSPSDWAYNFCDFLCRGSNRKILWHSLKGQGPSCRWSNLDFIGDKNFSGTPRLTYLIKRIY